MAPRAGSVEARGGFPAGVASTEVRGGESRPRPILARQAWPALPATATVAPTAPEGRREADRGQEGSGAELPNSLGRCPSTANLQGFYRATGTGVPWPTPRCLPLPEVFVDAAEAQGGFWTAAQPPGQAGAELVKPSVAQLRPALVDISNTAAVFAACVERKWARHSPTSHPDANPQLVREYASDVMRSMLQRELHFMPVPDYMQRQPQINAKMRAILNDWLFEVHRKYTLRRETLFLAINLTDRYLSHAQVSRQRLQLVGVTALLIAAKFEEIEPPGLADLVYVTADSYTKQEIVDMEIAMLAVFRFEVAAPTPANFLQHFQAAPRLRTADADAAPPEPVGTAQADDVHDPVRADLAWYLVELAMLDIRMIRHPPSHVAAAALLLSNKFSGHRPAWPWALARLSGYAEEELQACATELGQLLEAAPQSSLQAIRSKYRHTDVLCKRPAGGAQLGPAP